MSDTSALPSFDTPMFDMPTYRGYFMSNIPPKETPIELALSPSEYPTPLRRGNVEFVCRVRGRYTHDNTPPVYRMIGHVWIYIDTPEEDRQRIIEGLVQLGLLEYNIVKLSWEPT